MSFDRAAESYDRTRVTDPEALAATLDLLERELGDRGRLLEIGVGTGALAVPLEERGLDVVGLDLSPAMLAQLRRKSPTLPVVVGDATMLPFPDGVFGGALSRWVLHLIPQWPKAVDELSRVVAHGGRVAIEPGGCRGEWLDVWERIEVELGPAVRSVGLGAGGRRIDDLDAEFARHGAAPRETVTVVHARTAETLASFFEEARARSFSWTWRVDEGALAQGLDVVEEWARERYGDLDAVTGDMQMEWRVYDLP